MKIQVPADLDPIDQQYFIQAYLNGWKDFRRQGYQDEALRADNPVAYDAGFSAALTATMNWSRRKR